MATFLTNHSRCWSFESTDSQLGQFESEFVQRQLLSSNKLKGRKEYEGSSNNYERCQIDKKIQSVKRKGANFDSNKTSNVSSRNVKNVSNKDDPCKVKTSALLYEITDRVNRLAQPRIRSNVSDESEPRLNVKKISEATPRILELSRPKSIYEPPSKLLYYVSPAALTAIPTERILELSRPKKNAKKVPGRKRKLIYAPCNSRILHLARVKSSKQNIDDRSSKSSSRQPRKLFRMEFQKPNKLESRRGKESSYDQNRSKKNPKIERRTRRRKRMTKQEPKYSRSDKTIIMID